MSEENLNNETEKKIFTLEDFDAADTAPMTVLAFGNSTGWVWTFAGPGHEKTIAYNDRNSRVTLKLEKEQTQQRLNGKKVKVEDETLESRRAKNVDWIVARLLGWSPMRMSKDGPDFPFNEKNARDLLADQRKIDIYTQAVDFLTGEATFIKGSATT